MVMVLTLAPEFGWCIQCIPSHPFFSEPNFGHVPRVATGRHGSQAASLLKFTELRATFGHCNSPDDMRCKRTEFWDDWLK